VGVNAKIKNWEPSKLSAAGTTDHLKMWGWFQHATLRVEPFKTSAKDGVKGALGNKHFGGESGPHLLASRKGPRSQLAENGH